MRNEFKTGGLRFVAIGGGNGLSTLLSGLKKFVGTEIGELSAIVAVTDDGGSSGRLRDELQMLPPGDIRNCIVALSEDSQTLSKLFRHRFRGEGDLGGHVFGNLFLAALSEVTGDFAEAVKLSSEILASKGHIYPATVANVQLGAELSDGKIVRGETKIGHVGSMIERLFIEPADAKPLREVLDAVAAADVISLGPGSLYTSLLPPLLVQGVAEAIADSAAKKVFVSNLMTQPGETDGQSLAEHLGIIRRYASAFAFDFVVVNDEPISAGQMLRYAEEGAEQIGLDVRDEGRVDEARVVCGNLLNEGEMVRHDPEKLAETVLRCVAEPVAL